MSALIAVQITCNADDCSNTYTPSPAAADNVDQARRESHWHGWTSTGTRPHSHDYCPDHAEGLPQ